MLECLPTEAGGISIPLLSHSADFPDVEVSWISQVPEGPLSIHAPFFDPGGSGSRRPFCEPVAAFRTINVVGPHIQVLSWLNSAAWMVPVYASVEGYPHSRQHSVPTDGQSLSGRIGYLPGPDERFHHIHFQLSL